MKHKPPKKRQHKQKDKRLKGIKVINLDQTASNAEFNAKVFSTIEQWSSIQKIMKEHLIVEETIQKYKANDASSFEQLITEYFKATLQTREYYENIITIDKNKNKKIHYEIVSNYDNVLLNALNPIQNFLFLFRNNYDYIVKLVLISDNTDLKSSTISTLIELFVHRFYENILIPNPEQEELLILFYWLWEEEILNMKTPSTNCFIDESVSFVGKMLKSYTKKKELKSFLSMTWGKIIWNVEKYGNQCLDWNPSRIQWDIKQRDAVNNQEEKQGNLNVDLLGFLSSNIPKCTINYNKELYVEVDSDTCSEDEYDWDTPEYQERSNDLFEIPNCDLDNSESALNLSNNSTGLNRSFNAITTTSKQTKNLDLNLPLISLTRESHSITNSDSHFNRSSSNPELSNSNSDNSQIHFLSDSIKYNQDYKSELTLKEWLNRIRTEKSNNWKQFYIKQVDNIGPNAHAYTNSVWYQSITENKTTKNEIAKIYKRNYIFTKNLIDNILQALFDKATAIPYPFRCICKIIKVLIENKFPQLNLFEKNAFIGAFIFDKCIFPTWINSDFNTIITSTILSKTTKMLMKTITKIFTKINKLAFFEGSVETEFTMFNHYIIEVLPRLSKFYEKITDVVWPEQWNELITKRIIVRDIFGNRCSEVNGNTNTNSDTCNVRDSNKILYKKPAIVYDYFRQNKLEITNWQNICFCIEDLWTLIKYIKPHIQVFKHWYRFDFFEKSFKKIIAEEKNLEEYVWNNKTKRNFFLWFNTETNPNCNKIQEGMWSSKDINLKACKTPENEVLVKIKTCIKKVWTSWNIWSIKEYSYWNISNNTNNLFLAWKYTLNDLEDKNKPDTDKDNAIPLRWYSQYLSNNKRMLDSVYKENEYDKLKQELIEEETLALRACNEYLSNVITRHGLNRKCAARVIEKAKWEINYIQQIEQFNKMERFINSVNIDWCITFTEKKGSTEDNKKEFLLYFQVIKTSARAGVVSVIPLDKCVDKQMEKVNSTRNYVEYHCFNSGNHNTKSQESESELQVIYCHVRTIKDFITLLSKFPQIKDDIRTGENKYNISNVLQTYMAKIRHEMNKDLSFSTYSETEWSTIIGHIEDHIHKSLYQDIFPHTPTKEDLEFYNKTKSLNWIEPHHLDIVKLNANEIQFATKYLTALNKAQSITEKVKYVTNIYKVINNTIKFSNWKENEEFGAEDLSPIFQYMIIKSKPKRFISNVNYIRTFLYGNNLKGMPGYIYTQMNFASEFIFNVDHTMLNITEEEYNAKTNAVLGTTRTNNNNNNDESISFNNHCNISNSTNFYLNIT